MAKKPKKGKKPRKAAKAVKAPSKPKLNKTDLAILKLTRLSSFEKVLLGVKALSKNKLSASQKRELKWILSNWFVGYVRQSIKGGKPIPEKTVHEVNELKNKLWMP